MIVNEQDSQVNGPAGRFTEQAIRDWLVLRLSGILDVNPETIQIREPLTSYGLGSIQAVTLVADIEDWLGWMLPPTLLWDYPTLEEVARYLAEQSASQ